MLPLSAVAACDAPPGWWCNGTRHERVAVARSFHHPPPASADRVSPLQKRRALSTSPKTPSAPLPLPPSSPPASPNTSRTLTPSSPPGLAPSLPRELSLHIEDVPSLTGTGPGSEHFSSFVTGAGMTTALFITLGIAFMLNVYRRRRQLQQRHEQARRRRAQALELYDASFRERTTGSDGNPILTSPEVQDELSLLRARAAAIDALPTRTVARSEVADAAAEPLECSICLGDLAVGEKLSQLPCGHEFHGACAVAQPWPQPFTRTLTRNLTRTRTRTLARARARTLALTLTLTVAPPLTLTRPLHPQVAVGSARADLSALQGLSTPARPERGRRARWPAAPGDDEQLAAAPGARPARRQHGPHRRAPTRAQPALRPPQRAHRCRRIPLAHRRRGHVVAWSRRPRRPRCDRADRSRRGRCGRRSRGHERSVTGSCNFIYRRGAGLGGGHGAPEPRRHI